MDDGLRNLERFRAHRVRVAQSADKLVHSMGTELLAMPLRDLVHGVGIAQVVFKPMFASGGLVRRNYGFEMHVDCRRSEAQEWARRFHDDSDRGVSLPAQTRMTIAHEVAHVLALATPGFRNFGSSRLAHRRQRSWLERLCDNVAGRILLPIAIVERIVPNGGIMDANRLRDLAVQLRVPPELLINRLRESGLWRERQRGTVLLFRRSRTGYRLASGASDPTTCALLTPSGSEGQQLPRLLKTLDSYLKPADEDAAPVWSFLRECNHRSSSTLLACFARDLTREQDVVTTVHRFDPINPASAA